MIDWVVVEVVVVGWTVVEVVVGMVVAKEQSAALSAQQHSRVQSSYAAEQVLLTSAR